MSDETWRETTLNPLLDFLTTHMDDAFIDEMAATFQRLHEGAYHQGDVCLCPECVGWAAYIAGTSPPVRAAFDECVAAGQGWEPGAMEELIDGPQAAAPPPQDGGA